MNTTSPGTASAPPRAPWRFVRRERGRMIAGVSTGMADAFHIDVVVIRVLWVIAAIAGGLGVAAYIICWLAFPSDQHPAPISRLSFRESDSHLRNAGVIAAIVLIGLGLVSMFGAILPPFRHGGEAAWATLLIGGGVAVLLFRNQDDHGRDPTPPVPPAPGSVPERDTDPASDPGPTDADTTTTEATTPGPAPFSYPPTPPVPPQPPTTSAWTQHAPWPAPPPKPPRVRRRHHRPFLTPLTISVLLIGAGVAALLDSAGSVHLTAAGVLASGLIVVGAALMLSAWYGRAHGLIPIGVILLLATIPAASIDVPISGGVGERAYHPITRSQMHGNYELGVGRLEINLKDAPLTNRVTSISGSLGIGQLEVNVPSDVRVVVRAHAGAGATDLFDSPFRDPQGGWPQNTSAEAGVHQRGVLYLDLRVGAGVIRVHRWSPTGVPLPA